MIRKAIDRCGRDMVLSLSPGPAPLEHAESLKANANMWRVTDDFWDLWPLLLDMFERCEKWTEHVGPGRWPDCDMLPLGHLGIRSVDGGGSDRFTRFTKDEQLTMMTLWSIFRSPLMFGGEMRDNDKWTLSLLTNRDVLYLHRHGFGAHQVSREAEKIVWIAKDNEGAVYAALFNVGDDAATVSVSMVQLGLTHNPQGKELWTGERANVSDGQLSANLPPHGTALYRLEP
ncbi:Alpha-galactosidase A precursor [compost metagenome]